MDLYLILKQHNWPIQQLKKDAAIKHGIHQDIVHIARQLLRSVEFTDTPKILIPLNKKDMDEFFLSLAKSLEGEIFK